MQLCKHSSTEHSEMFPKRGSIENKCDMCYKQFNSKEETTHHMSERHSPESFYEKIVEDISGECRVCKKEFCSGDMEEHFQKYHSKISNTETNANSVLQILLELVDKIVQKSSDNHFKILGGGNETKLKHEVLHNVKIDSDDDDLTGEESETEVNPIYEYNYSEKKERFVGNKPCFIEVVEELKTIFGKKPSNSMMINDHKIQIKDYRTQKYGVEIDVEVKTSKTRGFANLKIWGPSEDKKKCTIMMSKSKLSEDKFATVLSRKIIKPLIDCHIKGDDIHAMIAHIPNSNDKVTCDKCKKLINKSYLKTHIQNQHPKCNICSETFVTKISLKEHNANKHSSVSIKILKEVGKDKQGNRSLYKPFQSKTLTCDVCSFTSYSERYLWMHKEKSHVNDPTDEEMIGAKRDVTLVKTSSISEPVKKKRALKTSTEGEEKDPKQRSNKIDEEENKVKHINEKNLEKKNMELQTKEEKNEEKINKNHDKKQKEEELENKLKHHKLKRLPKAVHCPNPNSIEYISEGNGACCVNCLAMWLFLNKTEMGPQTGRDLNTFIGSYRTHFQPLLEFPIDIVIGVGGKKIRFEKGEEDSFFDTLVSSQKMSFMWRDGFDIQALTDMTQLSIEVTVYNNETNLVENVQTFEPTPNFPWNENDAMKPTTQKYKRNTMKLINYKNQHFNLIVDENDEIVKMLVPKGSDQQNDKNGDTENIVTPEVKELSDKLKIAEKSNKDLKEKLKVSEESKKKVQIDHKEALKEVARLQESVEKYKLENKTLTEFKTIIYKETTPILAPEVSKTLVPGPISEGQVKVALPATKVVNPPDYQSSSPPAGVSPPESWAEVVSEPSSPAPAPWTTVLPSNRKFQKRTGSGSESHQRNCPKCYFQSSCKDEMDNHFKMSHVAKGDISKVVIRTERITCRNCKVEFSNYWSLMNHRRDNHPTDKACRYDLEDRCKHSSEECWYKHKNGKNPSNQTTKIHLNSCFECEMNFRNTNGLMMHKKTEHIEQCKPCDKYMKNECSRESTCWYPHTQSQDFHINQQNLRPPNHQSQ